MVKRLIPFVQVLHRRIYAAVSQDQAREALIGSFEPIISLRVAMGAIVDDRYARLVGDRMIHLERLKDVLLQKCGE